METKIGTQIYLPWCLPDLLEGMGTEFAVGYVNTIDGEQDPRNLLIIFKMTVTILQHFSIGMWFQVVLGGSRWVQVVLVSISWVVLVLQIYLLLEVHSTSKILQ